MQKGNVSCKNMPNFLCKISHTTLCWNFGHFLNEIESGIFWSQVNQHTVFGSRSAIFEFIWLFNKKFIIAISKHMIHTLVYCFMNAKWNSERHMKQSISPASLNLESWNLVSATAWPSPDHTPIFSQIGGEMTEKSPILRVIKQIWEFSDNQSFLRHFFTNPAENWCVNRGET